MSKGQGRASNAGSSVCVPDRWVEAYDGHGDAVEGCNPVRKVPAGPDGLSVAWSTGKPERRKPKPSGCGMLAAPSSLQDDLPASIRSVVYEHALAEATRRIRIETTSRNADLELLRADHRTVERALSPAGLGATASSCTPSSARAPVYAKLVDCMPSPDPVYRKRAAPPLLNLRRYSAALLAARLFERLVDQPSRDSVHCCPIGDSRCAHSYEDSLPPSCPGSPCASGCRPVLGVASRPAALHDPGRHRPHHGPNGRGSARSTQGHDTGRAPQTGREGSARIIPSARLHDLARAEASG